MGHHCVLVGYQKQFADARPELDGGISAAQNIARPNSTAALTLRAKRWCGGGGCLRLAMLPVHLFPGAGTYPEYRATALVGRSVRPVT